MNKKLPLVLGLIVSLSFTFSCSNSKKDNDTKTLSITETRALHKKNLESSPFKATKDLSKKDRAAKGLPPKRFMERLWELTMNPTLGKPTPENLAIIQKELLNERTAGLATGRVPGDDSNNNWVERGPNNVGGRTRALLFDPNDATNETVFAGGVSGGLWKNTKISDPATVWTSVGIPENLNITCITVDPNNSKIMYLGTGESYVSGDVNGNGVWKSTDGGNSWNHVFGGAEGETILQTDSEVVINSPSSIAGSYLSISASFGPKATTNITENLVLVDAGGATATEGCTALVNGSEINGKIALVYRGNCDFTEKVINAQNAGAKAVIVINNVDGSPISMGGEDLAGVINIPSVMITMDAGSKLVAEMSAGNTVNATITATAGEYAGFYVLKGNQHVNDIVVRDNNGVSEVYIAAGATFYSDASPSTLFGPDDYGLFKSTNAGESWSLLGLPLTSSGNRYEPNDIEIGADNTVWVASKTNQINGDGGGAIFASTDGNAFVLKKSLAARRTQIAASPTDANKLYVLAEGSNVPVVMVKTTDGFATTTDLTLPDDADTGINANDFTRGQAFYDLVIKLDPTNDEKVFVGGIDLFSSTDGGTVWTQLSHWYAGFGFPYVHADQHAIVFGNGDSSKMLFGHDGGVTYSATSGTLPMTRNNGYNVTQFYTVGVAPSQAIEGDYFAAGAQDNGTQYFANSAAGIGASDELTGGDGAYTLFDEDGTDTYVITNYVYNNSIVKYDYKANVLTTINSEGDDIGEFINPQVLDSRLDLLYSNYSSEDDFAVKIYRTKGNAPYALSTLKNALLDSPVLALQVDPYATSSSGLVYLGLENGKLLKVENPISPFGKRWTEITGPSFVGSISDIEFGQTSNDIFVTFHNYGVNNIWFTNDGGTTWSQKDGNLPDMPVKAILQNPLKADEVIVGTELGVWYTTDFSSDSPQWKSAFNGMSNVKVMDLDLRDDNTIYAATYGRGVFSGKFTGEALSIEENVLASGISLYPTVSNGEFQVNSKTNLGEVNLQIFNLSGQTVYVKNLNLSGNTASDISINVASGVYLAKFTEGGTSTTKKFIIE
ncbi:T9SS type A sorting domain-containing protein [Formosa sp. 3Alg 14/1]|uniref:T9SS type A sorting domain-containing protein n=1 Tax=Formosa sp. 3Alg 14/1 TaxID=3382190 RepID=UPI0039BE9CE5